MQSAQHNNAAPGCAALLQTSTLQHQAGTIAGFLVVPFRKPNEFDWLSHLKWDTTPLGGEGGQVSWILARVVGPHPLPPAGGRLGLS